MLRPILYTSQLGIRISSSDLLALEKAAKELHLNKTLVVRLAIQEFLDRHGNQTQLIQKNQEHRLQTFAPDKAA